MLARLRGGNRVWQLTDETRCASQSAPERGVQTILRPQRHPKYLYKYRSLETEQQRRYVESTVIDGMIYFPRPREFNDPFDCFPVPKKMSKAEIKKYVNGVWKRKQPAQSRHERRAELKQADKRLGDFDDIQRQMIDEVVNSVGVLSLSEKPNDVLMWSHYSASHTGIGLRFKVSAEKPFFTQALPVLYQLQRPILDLLDDNPHEQSEKALLTKADFWHYEQEWRIIEHQRGPGVHPFPLSLLDGIILGARITRENRDRVLEWVARRNAPTELLEATFDDQLFSMRIRPYK